MLRTPSPLSLLALGAAGSVWLFACGSSNGASQGSGGSGAGSSTTSSISTSGGASSSTSSSSSGMASSSGSASTSSSGMASSSSSGSTSSSGSVWTPTAAGPIHFHWMIGGFKTADILTGQAGQVVYDIDGEGATAADVAAIHAAGAIAVCYVDVGSLEQGRSDYAQFPASVIGPPVVGWPGENWLLVTAANQSTILPLMKARFVNWCQAKGFDAIEPDNLDAWTNISNVTEADNLAYDLAIAGLAHGLPLSIGLKNALVDISQSQSASQVPSFVSAFDWALNEQCYEYQECSAYTAAGSFIPSGKAVFDVEYNVDPDCTQANQVHMNAQRTDLDLVGATSSGYQYAPCIPDSMTTW